MKQNLQEWDDYASTFESTKHLSKIELRDNSKTMLLTMVKEIDISQSNQQQYNKSKSGIRQAGLYTELLDIIAAIQFNQFIQ
jgi:hypothetical protein